LIESYKTSLPSSLYLNVCLLWLVKRALTVVAQEIRALAEDSGKATDKIAVLIN